MNYDIETIGIEQAAADAIVLRGASDAVKKIGEKGFGSLEASASGINGAVDFYTEILRDESISTYNGVNSKTTFLQDYNISTSGDYVEFEARLNKTTDIPNSTLGMVGKNDGTNANTMGWLSLSEFRVRDTNGAWIVYSGASQYGSPTQFNKYKIIKVGTNLELYINGNLVSSQAMTGDIVINGIANTYLLNFTNCDFKYININTVSGNLLSTAIANDSSLTNTAVTGSIVNSLQFNSKDKIYVEVIANPTPYSVAIFIPTTKGGYLKYTLRNQTSVSVNAAVWRIKIIEECDGARAVLRPITIEGEHETAVYIDGAGNAMGGVSHGNEVKTGYSFLVDGVNLNDAITQSFYCRKIELFQESNLFAPTPLPNAGDKVATNSKRWEFNASGKFWQLDNSITWETAESIRDSYQLMLPLARFISGVQFTDSVRFSPVTTKYDISADGHSAPILSDGKFGKRAIVSGELSRFECIVELLSDVKSTSKFWVSNSSLYNKIYSSAVADSYTTSVGEVITHKSRVYIDLY